MPFRSCDHLSAALAFVCRRHLANGRRLGVCGIYFPGTGGDPLSKEFADQDKRKALMAGHRHIPANFSDPNIDLSVANPYRMIYADIRVK